MNNSKGLIVAFEGISCSGKTSLIRELERELGARCSTYKFPSKNRSGLEFRRKTASVPMCTELKKQLQLLEFCDFADFSKRIIQEKNEGKIILLDRFKDSCFAYQQATKEEIKKFLYAFSFIPNPDLTVFIDLDIETSLQRIEQRNDDKSLFRRVVNTRKFQQTGLKGYKKIFSKEKDNVLKLDGLQPLEELCSIVLDKIKEMTN